MKGGTEDRSRHVRTQRGPDAARARRSPGLPSPGLPSPDPRATPLTQPEDGADLFPSRTMLSIQKFSQTQNNGSAFFRES